MVLWESIWLYKFFIVALTYRSSPALYAFNTAVQSILVEKLIFGVSWRGLVKDFLARSAACFAAVYLCDRRSVDTGVFTLVQIYSLSFSWLATLSYVFVWQNFFQLTTTVSPFVYGETDGLAEGIVADGDSIAMGGATTTATHSEMFDMEKSPPHFLFLTRIASTLQNIDSIYNPKFLLFLILASGIAATSLALRECHGRALLFSLLYYSRCVFYVFHGVSAPAWMILCVIFAHIFQA